LTHGQSWHCSKKKNRHAIPYADAFAAATAHAADAVLLTGDPDLEQLAAVLPIEKLKRA
jgi:predicted nucleic acid-binding protein